MLFHLLGLDRCRSHYIIIQCFWSTPLVIYDTKMLIDLAVLVNITFVARMSNNAHNDGLEFPLPQIVMYVCALGLALGEGLQAAHRWLLLPSKRTWTSGVRSTGCW